MRILYGVLIVLLISGTSAAQTERTGYKYLGAEYRGDALPVALRQSLYELEIEFNDQRRQQIDQYVLQEYLKERSQREGISVEKLQQQLLAFETPSEKEVRAFYDANKRRIRGTFAQSREQLARYLSNQRRQARLTELVGAIKAEKGYEVILPEPEAPIFDVVVEGYPFKGNPRAKVTVIEFADYQCPHCKNAVSLMKRLVQRYGDQIRVVFRDYPINRSGISRKIAEGAVCAKEQGHFWEYHDLAFEQQAELDMDTPMALAKRLNLDVKDFESCYAKPGTRERVSTSLNEAQMLGLKGTPTFFVNGRMLHVHGDIEPALIASVEKALGSVGRANN